MTRKCHGYATGIVCDTPTLRIVRDTTTQVLVSIRTTQRLVPFPTYALSPITKEPHLLSQGVRHNRWGFRHCVTPKRRHRTIRMVRRQEHRYSPSQDDDADHLTADHHGYCCCHPRCLDAYDAQCFRAKGCSLRLCQQRTQR